MLNRDTDDRLPTSYPFLTMLASTAFRWLIVRQTPRGSEDEFGCTTKVGARFYLMPYSPEALELRAAAHASADVLNPIGAEALLA